MKRHQKLLTKKNQFQTYSLIQTLSLIQNQAMKNLLQANFRMKSWSKSKSLLKLQELKWSKQNLKFLIFLRRWTLWRKRLTSLKIHIPSAIIFYLKNHLMINSKIQYRYECLKKKQKGNHLKFSMIHNTH